MIALRTVAASFLFKLSLMRLIVDDEARIPFVTVEVVRKHPVYNNM
jgi:hypothetical protein